MCRWRRICVLDWIHNTKDCPLCYIFIQATSRGSAPPETHPQPASNCKPTLVSRLASEYFDINLASFYDFRVLGIAECQDDEGIETETEPRALLLRTSARHNYELKGPRGRLIENPIDWRAVQQWINFCDEEHATSCIFEPESALKGLQFIDCETLQIFPSPERSPPYITLSYLWSRAGGLEQGSLSEDIPLVIKDAIKVVKELGWRYLWVDRYCIPQENGPEKDNLIYNMDQIYRGATLSIIANGEQNLVYGLPGVSSISRLPQPSIQIASEQYTLCWINMREMVAQSEWSTRGWTFQEALLSTRKLVFNDTQLYFQCNSMLSMEMVLWEWPNGYQSEATRSWKVFPHDPRALTVLDLCDRIAEYRKRQLKYTSDRYKAFQGILQKFFQMDHPVKSLYGLPLEDGTFSISTNCELLQVALCWASNRRATRNPLFPSWTWVGWEAIANDLGDHEMDTYIITYPIGSTGEPFFRTETSVKFEDGTEMPFEEQYNDILQKSSVMGPPFCLVISGTVFDFYLSGYSTNAHHQMTELSPLPPGWSSAAYFDDPDRRLGGLRLFIGLMIMVGDYFNKDAIVVLLLAPKDSSTYERIGLGKLILPQMDITEQRRLVKSPTSINGFSNVRKQTVRIV